MKKVRLLSAGAIAGMAGVIALPMSAHADTAAPTGTAQASALQVSISPSALISAVPAVGQLLSQTLGGVLGNADLTIRVDAANANGVLNANLLDLLSGHGDSTPLDIKFAPLQQELDTLKNGLSSVLGLTSGLTGLLNGTGGLGGLGGVTNLGAIGAGSGGLLSSLTGLLGGSSSLLPQLSALTNQLPILNGVLGGLLGGNAPGSLPALDGILKGLNLGNTLVANYNVPGVQDHPMASDSVIATPAGAPIQLNLAPYHANAVTNSLAQAAGLSGARASADNSTTSLAVTPSLSLPNLTNLLGTKGLGDLLGPNSLLNSLLAPTSGLPIVGDLLRGITGGPAASSSTPLGGVVQSVLGSAGGTSLLGGILGGNGLLGSLGGLTSGLPAVGPVLGSLTGTTPAGSATGILGNTGLLGALTGPNGLIGGLTNLQNLLSPTGLLGGLLNGQNLGLNSLLKTTDVTSNAIVQPMTGGAFQSLASTKVGSVQVLPLGDQLLGSLSSILGGTGGIGSALSSITGGLNLGSLTNIGPLSGLLGGAGAGGLVGSGLPLLEITGVTSSAQAILGPNAGDPTGASSLGAIKVLGIPVVNLDQVVGLAVGQSKTIAIPATGISLIIDRGVPQIGMNTATSKSVSVAALNVRLVNDGTGLLGSLLSAGNKSKPITEVALANSVATVSTAPANTTVPAIAPINGPTPPSTGMFGPASLAAAGILAALAMALQVFPRLAARRGSVR